MKKLNRSQVNSRLKKLSLIRSNIKNARDYIQTEFKELFSKSDFYDKSLRKEDNSSFETMYEVLTGNIKRVYTNKSLQEKLIGITNKYGIFAYKRLSTISRHFTKSARNEYLELFMEIENPKVMEFLKENGFMNDPNFRRSFFNSAYFVPLYKKYRKGDYSKTTEMWQNKTNSTNTLWGDNLISFAHKYAKKRNIKIEYEVDYEETKKE